MPTEFQELIPGLPEDLALECLTRLHFSAHRSSSAVCRRWRSLLLSPDFYYHRKKTGFTQRSACLVQSNPGLPGSKPAGEAKYNISVFDPVGKVWERVEPVPKYPNGLPLFCHVASTEGKLVVLGGWDPVSYEPIEDVFIYDFATRRWAESAPMPTRRSFFAAAAVSGKVYVAGGHDPSKNALGSAYVYDLKSNDWTELARMSEERDECYGLIVNGSGFWVVSGYGTDTQGEFKTSAEVYDFGSGTWARVEDVWARNTCPRSNVGISEGPNGNTNKLIAWSGSDQAVRVGTCGVDLGGRVLVAGTGYQGGPHGFYLREGEKGKLVKLDVPDEFSGFVQTGCCVEI